MKIVYVLSGTSLTGGANKSFLNLLNAVVANGFEAIVVCPDKNGVYGPLSHMHGVKTECLDFTYNILPATSSVKDLCLFIPRLIKRLIRNRVASRQLVKLCKAFRPDIVHSNTSVNNVGFLAARRLRIPHIWHIREYGDLDFGMHIMGLKRRLSAKGNYCIAITDDIARHRRILGSHNSTVIYNGIAPSAQVCFNPDKKGYILYAGRIQHTKGISDLIDAYISYVSKAPASKILRLKIAGNYTEQRDYSALQSALGNKLHACGIDCHVDWLGDCTNIYELMQQATVTVVPSLFEGFGRVMPEAMFNGSLVIGRNTGGTKEQFDNGLRIVGEEIGIRFETTSQLADALLEVSAKGIRSFFPVIQRSQCVVRQLYTNEAYAEGVIDFYHKIANA